MSWLLDLDTGNGTFNDASLVRGILADAIKASPKKRQQIAEEMSDLLSVPITVAMLNSYTSEAHTAHRFPLSFTRAFCELTGDTRLLSQIAERAGFTLIDEKQRLLLDLGREYLRRKEADAAVAELASRIVRGTK